MCSIIGQNIQEQVRLLDEMILMQSNTWELASGSRPEPNRG
jgi:hypothetical protein